MAAERGELATPDDTPDAASVLLETSSWYGTKKGSVGGFWKPSLPPHVMFWIASNAPYPDQVEFAPLTDHIIGGHQVLRLLVTFERDPHELDLASRKRGNTRQFPFEGAGAAHEHVRTRACPAWK